MKLISRNIIFSLMMLLAIPLWLAASESSAQALGKITILYTSNNMYREVSFQWSPFEVNGVSASSYSISRGPTASTLVSDIATTTLPAFTDSGLVNNTRYTYKVVAKDAMGVPIAE